MGTTFSLSSPLSSLVWFVVVFFLFTEFNFKELNYKVLKHIFIPFPALDKFRGKEKAEKKQQNPLKLRWKWSTPSVNGRTVD